MVNSSESHDASRLGEEPNGSKRSLSVDDLVEESQPGPKGRPKVLQFVLMVIGFVFLVGIIWYAGPAKVWAAVQRAGVFLPLLIVCECLWFSGEALGHYSVFGSRAREIPKEAFVRTVMMSYAIMILIPLGKAGAEVAKLLSFRRFVPGAVAGAAAANVQIASLLANALISGVCLVAVGMVLAFGATLVWFIGLNVVLVTALALAIFLVSRGTRWGKFLEKYFSNFRDHSMAFDKAVREGTPQLRKAVGWAFFGRIFQTLGYGTMLLAVGGELTFLNALLSQGVHLVGAGLGDFIPGHLGVHEGAYTLAAPSLSLSSADALAIPLIARVTQYTVAAFLLLVGAVWKDPFDPA